MEPGSELQKRLVGGTSVFIDIFDALVGSANGCKGLIASFRACIGGIVDGKNSQHRITNKLEYFAVVLDHRTGDTIIILVQYGQIFLARLMVSEGRRLSEIRKPDHSMKLFTVAAFDRSVVHPFPGIATKVSLQQRQ